MAQEKHHSPYPNETVDFWNTHINNFKDSNLSRKAYCRKAGINYDRFQYWYYKSIKPGKAQKKFIQATLESPAKLTEAPLVLKKDLSLTNDQPVCSLNIQGKGLVNIFDKDLALQILTKVLS